MNELIYIEHIQEIIMQIKLSRDSEAIIILLPILHAIPSLRSRKSDDQCLCLNFW